MQAKTVGAVERERERERESLFFKEQGLVFGEQSGTHTS